MPITRARPNRTACRQCFAALPELSSGYDHLSQLRPWAGCSKWRAAVSNLQGAIHDDRRSARRCIHGAIEPSSAGNLRGGNYQKTRDASLMAGRHGPDFIKRAQQEHEPHPKQGYGSRNDRSAACAWHGLPLQTPCTWAPRKTRSCLCPTIQNHSGPRLLLASASRMPAISHSQDKNRILASKAASEPAEGCAARGCLAGARMECADDLGVRIGRY